MHRPEKRSRSNFLLRQKTHDTISISWNIIMKNDTENPIIIFSIAGLKTPTWPGRLFVAESESGEVVGFAAFGPDRASGFPGYTAELWAIYVLPTWQRKGLWRALFHEGARLLQAEGYGRMLVWVLKENPKGRGFYEHLCGVLLGEREI